MNIKYAVVGCVTFGNIFYYKKSVLCNISFVFFYFFYTVVRFFVIYTKNNLNAFYFVIGAYSDNYVVTKVIFGIVFNLYIARNTASGKYPASVPFSFGRNY